MLFSLLDMILTLFWPNTQGQRSGESGSNPFRMIMDINMVAGVLACLIAPHLVRTYDRMHQRMTRQNNELRSLHVLDNAIASEMNLVAILDVTVKQATLAVDGELGALWVMDELPSGGVTQAFYNVSSAVQSGLLEWMTSSDPSFTHHRDHAHRRQGLDTTWKTDPVAAALNLRNFISVPIKWRNVPVGFLVIGNRGDTLNPLQGFTDADQELLTAVASTVAVAVHNARVHEEAQRRGATLRTLVARTAEAIAASSDAPRLMQVLAEEASRLISCERVAVYAVDPARDRLQPLAAHDGGTAHGTPPASFYTQDLPLRLFPEPYADPEPGAVHDWGRQYVDDVRVNLCIPEGEATFLSGPGWVFGLRSRDQRRLGLLCLLDARHPPRTPDTTAFAQALAAQAAVALENAQLSQQSQSLLERAQALQTATNQIAAEHDTTRVLEGVMESARGVLDADGYTLWGYDAESDWTQRASHGVGIPAVPGGGDAPEIRFLSRVMKSRQSKAIADLHSTAGHLDWDMDCEGGMVRAILALPLLYAGQAIGVMALYYETPQLFQPDEIALAQSFAHQAANALENARLFTELRGAYNRERRIAERLQRSLLPPIPSRIGPFEFSHKYQAGLAEASVGGDIYDLFVLDDQRIGIMMADVSGKGLDAAVQTAMIKYTLRAFAQENPDDPGIVLERVNNVLRADASRLDGFVTLIYAVLNTVTGELAYANGGHEPPLLWEQKGGSVRMLELTGGMALGCLAGITYDACTLVLEPGDMLMLFTDGLTEARTPENEFLDQEGLMEILANTKGSASVVVETVYNTVNAYAENDLHDDVAILLMQRLADEVSDSE